MKKYMAEGLGAGMLTLVVGLSLVTEFAVATPVLAAIVLGLFVYTIGFVSGCHINPAVTIGAWSIGKISLYDALWYIVAQVLGALIALSAFWQLDVLPASRGVDTLGIGIAEMAGAFIFTFGIAAVLYARTPAALSGVVIGLSLLLGIALSSLLGAAGVLNPAVALGIGILSPMYMLAPIAGAVLGMQAYKYLQS